MMAKSLLFLLLFSIYVHDEYHEGNRHNSVANLNINKVQVQVWLENDIRVKR